MTDARLAAREQDDSYRTIIFVGARPYRVRLGRTFETAPDTVCSGPYSPLHCGRLRQEAFFPNDSMTATQTDLPSFRHPPVGEVVLALQFENLDKLDVRHAGALAERFRERFPRFMAQAPLDPVFERFGEFRPAPTLSLQMADLPLFPRLWLIDEKDVELVQIQRDRLMHNWRRMSGSEEYPRYTRLREAFLQDWTTMSAFVDELELGALLPTQCEVSYVNHIDVGPLEGGYPDPSTIFSFLSPTLATHGDAVFEAVTFSSSGIAKALTSKGQEIAGRMYVELTSGTNQS